MNWRRVQIDFREPVSQRQVALRLLPFGGGREPDGEAFKWHFAQAPRNVRQASCLPVRAESCRPNDGTGMPRETPGWKPAPSFPSNARSIPNARLVERLSNATLFQEFQRAFGDATGLPLTLRAVEGWQLAHRSDRHQNGFCALMSQANRSCSACLQVQQRVCAGVNGVPCTLSCSFGLTETAVGVKIGQETVAYLQTGQVFFKTPTPAQTQRALEQIGEWGLDLDREEVARRYQETPVVRRNEYQARVRLLQFFADQLGTLANQILLHQKDVEPPQITRARHVIEARYQEDLSLAAVAREVGMSAFYFCKKFKQATSMNFTHYVSRVRVERAKSLLLNLNYRVSEIAFEVGFQSLTHFNRIFKSIAGQSPTEFRRHLPGLKATR